MIGTDLEDYRKVRTRLGRGSFADEVTVNDVILATIAGAFRSWLLTRGESVYPGTTIRAMVPVSVHDGDDAPDRCPGHRVLRRPARGGARPVDAAAPDRLLDAPADGGRLAPRGVGRHALRPGRVRAADDARARRPARRHGVAPPLQRRHHQRARPADPALRRRRAGWSRPTRSPRSAASRPSRSG